MQDVGHPFILGLSDLGTHQLPEKILFADPALPARENLNTLSLVSHPCPPSLE